ncbi:hypothetical protein CRM22_010910, partial [Opisthorchis felineus]
KSKLLGRNTVKHLSPLSLEMTISRFEPPNSDTYAPEFKYAIPRLVKAANQFVSAAEGC